VTASTVGLEAHIAGKPVISVDMSVFTPDAPYAAMRISTGTNSLSELANTVKKWASSRPTTPLSAVTQPLANTASAAQNILNVILDLVPSSPE
jgi:UDP-N-acetylglucosamine 2-epimerase